MNALTGLLLINTVMSMNWYIGRDVSLNSLLLSVQTVRWLVMLLDLLVQHMMLLAVYLDAVEIVAVAFVCYLMDGSLCVEMVVVVVDLDTHCANGTLVFRFPDNIYMDVVVDYLVC